MGHRPKAPGAASARKADDVAILFAQAVASHRAGRLTEARAGYNTILKTRPDHFGALHLLGLSEHQQGNSQSAERLLKRALLVEPQSAAARYDLGLVLTALRQPQEALTCFDRLVVLKPDFADGHLNRGNVLLGLGRFTEAIASYDKAILLDPRQLDALTNKGQALHQLGQFADAIACYDTVLTLQPAHLSALVNRGAALKDLRQADQALAAFDRVLALDPNHTIALINRGETLILLRRLGEALDSFDRAVSIDNGHAIAWLGRANILMMTKRVAEALDACQRALALAPQSVKALTQIGQCHALLGDADTAIAFFDRALAIKPDDETALVGRMFSMNFSHGGGFAPHQAARAAWWLQVGAKIAAAHPDPQHANDRDPARRIVVGYVSADFRRHSAAYAFRPVLQNHDPSQVEVICYSNSAIEDSVTASFRNAARLWRNVLQWSDDELVDAIRADKVDILVDLSGHTEGNRLRVFARKPAPIQVTAWGDATGTGMPAIDYMFADPVRAPAEVRHHFAERIFDLPCTIIIEPPPAELRASDAPVTANGHVTYGAFTRASRVSYAVIEVWSRILKSNATSRLLLKDHLLDDVAIQARLLEGFAACGIPPDRIDLMGSTSREEHLAAYRRIDICLDPFPHGGGVSTWETLHMGVPVVTLLGNSLASRLGGAILSAADLPDWVATDVDLYVDIALRATPERLQTLRHALPGMIARRCGPAAYTRAVEDAYRTMWRNWCGA